MMRAHKINIVMAGLDPATQGHTLKQRPWVATSRAAMTDRGMQK
jgi:hypothetical protein